MNIAVYGDSFAGINTNFFPNTYAPEDCGPAWVELLQSEGGHIVTNFSAVGSAFLFSYEKFLEQYKNFDLNIVVVTSPDRTYIKALDGLLIFGEEYLNHEVERIRKSSWYVNKNKHLRILESVRVYLKDWADWDMKEHTQHLLVNNMWRLSPNTIVIPGFFNSIEQTKHNLHDLAQYELKVTDPKENENNPLGKMWDNKVITCRRKCHLCAENNRILYNLIDEAIKEGKQFVELKLDLFVEPAVKDYYYYVKVLETS